MADRDGDGWEDENDPDPDRASEYHDYYGGRRPRPEGWAGGTEEEYQARQREEEEWRNENAADDAENVARNNRNSYTSRGGDPRRLPPGHPERVAAERADANSRWDAMSWEERQAARGRGESRDGGYGGGGGGISDFDRTSADIPLWGDLSGARGRIARLEQEREAARRAGILGDLAEFMPSADDLSVEYGNEDMIGPGEDSLMARDAFREWSEGGFTDADRAMMDEARRRSGMTARADREANMSALEARGMGGSGATLAAMMGAGEAAADRGASMDATMMGAAQQRQYNATTALGEFGGREDSYARGREGRNTDRENRTRESAAEAEQQAHENRLAHTDRAINYSTGGRNANEEEDEADESLGGAIAGLADSIF